MHTWFRELPALIDVRKHWYIQLLSQWPTIIGGLAGRVRIEKVVETTLVLGVYDTHWMQEIHLLSRTILKKVQACVGADKVTDIRCVWVQKKLKKP